MTGTVFISLLLIAIVCAQDNCSQTWFHLSDNGQCICGANVQNIIICDNETRQVRLQQVYCITSSGDGSNINVVGRCLPVVFIKQKIIGPEGNYYRILPNRAAQDNRTCSHVNHQGRMCSECKPNHTQSAYSYSFRCYHCTSGMWSNIAKYVTFAFFPLTLFLIVVVVFKIDILTPAMNVPILYCQLISSPFIITNFLSVTRNTGYYKFLQFIATVYGIWNLDFFRSVVPPICLPLEQVQLVALDYLVAVYPLLLLVCFYFIATAYDRGCQPLLRLSRIFLWCPKRLRRSKWYNKRTIKDAFISFLFLSYIKLLNTSFRMFESAEIHNEYGTRLGRYLVLDSGVKFMSGQHLPYAIIASTTLLLLIITPTLLQLFYPMLWFQRLLNKCKLNTPGLRLCMESFQGYYRDRTDGGWECRYFSVVYPTTRITAYVLLLAFHGIPYTLGFIVLCITVALLTLIVRPYKVNYHAYNTLDALLMLCLALFSIFVLQIMLFSDETDLEGDMFGLVTGALCLIPLAYFIIIIITNCFKHRAA